ncbi:MAG TPA: hypothetical protein VGJ53_02600 [Micromonosporaceae bacterium]|jgi:hypothetical protein
MSQPAVDGRPAVVPANEASWDDLRAVFGTDYPSRWLSRRGPLSVFEEPGFRDVARPSKRRVVVRIDLAPVAGRRR